MLSNYPLSIRQDEIMDCTNCELAVRRQDELWQSKRREVGETRGAPV